MAYTCDKCGDYVARFDDEKLTVELGPINDEVCGSCARSMIDSMVESYQDAGIIQSTEAEREFRANKWETFEV